MPHFLFLGDVALHWVALMSGLVSVLIAVFETFRKKRIVANTFWVIALICVLVACDEAWQDEHRNTEALESEKASQVALASTCRENARVEEALYAGSQHLVGVQTEMIGAQRRTIDQQQLGRDAQQRDVSSCVVSLGKMNPVVREQITVVTVPIATINSKGQFVPKNFMPDMRYVSELFVVTNETEQRFHGFLRCSQDFQIEDPPRLPTSAATFVQTYVPVNQLSPREYEIGVEQSATEWSPAHPAYLRVVSATEGLGLCTFTKA